MQYGYQFQAKNTWIDHVNRDNRGLRVDEEFISGSCYGNAGSSVLCWCCDSSTNQYTTGRTDAEHACAVSNAGLEAGGEGL